MRRGASSIQLSKGKNEKETKETLSGYLFDTTTSQRSVRHSQSPSSVRNKVKKKKEHVTPSLFSTESCNTCTALWFPILGFSRGFRFIPYKASISPKRKTKKRRKITYPVLSSATVARHLGVLLQRETMRKSHAG